MSKPNQFSDYDSDFPLLPGFMDSSWGNDACPSQELRRGSVRELGIVSEVNPVSLAAVFAGEVSGYLGAVRVAEVVAFGRFQLERMNMSERTGYLQLVANGLSVNVSGHLMRCSNVRAVKIHEGPAPANNPTGDCVRFTGHIVHETDKLFNTGFNGGTYGGNQLAGYVW